MAGRGLGYGVVLPAIVEEGALVEHAAESAGQLGSVAVEVVRSHLVDRDQDDQAMGGRGHRVRLPGRQDGGEREGEEEHGAEY